MFSFDRLKQKTFIVAEMSGNHNQSLDRAMEIINEAASCGADAIKIQTYTPDSLTLNLSGKKGFYIEDSKSVWAGRTAYDIYQEAALPYAWYKRIFARTQELNLVCFSTPFDAHGVDLLETFACPLYKVASAEIIDLPLLKKIAATGKPVIISTGMASLAEIDEAVKTIENHGNGQFALLKCTTAYPAPAEEANLRTIPHMAEAFHCPVGLSDHTMGSAVAVAAVALGARIVEKHFTLSRADGGPDSAFSMEPAEFRQMVQDIRTAEAALGKVNYSLTEKEKQSVSFRRSLFVVKNMEKGELFTESNVRCIRPGYGLHSRYLAEILERRAGQNIAMGTPLTWNIIS